MNRFMRPVLLCGIVLSLFFASGCLEKKQLTVSPYPDSGYNGANQGNANYGGNNNPYTHTDAEYGVYRPLTAEEQRAAQVLGSNVYFEYDSFSLTEEAKQILRAKAKTLTTVPQLRVVVEGHCDERGTDEYNMALAERRARVAYEYMHSLGVRPEQVELVSYGKLHPAVTGHDERAYSQNRRCEFKIGAIR